MILLTEEALLEALCFDFVVENPHEYLIDMFEGHLKLIKDRDDKEDELKDMAWGIAHDSFVWTKVFPLVAHILLTHFRPFYRYRTVLCVLYDVRIIAAACFIIAQRVIEGEHSPSLAARISPTSPASSLPTPPTNKPTSPDASRFAVEQLQFTEEQLAELARECRQIRPLQVLILLLSPNAPHPTFLLFISEHTSPITQTQ